MKRNTSKKPNLDEQEDGEYVQMLKNENVGSIELSDFIENMLDNMPDNKELAKSWKKKVNFLIDRFNTNFGHVYKKVK